MAYLYLSLCIWNVAGTMMNAFENWRCRFADLVGLLVNFQTPEELIAHRLDEPITSENPAFLRTMVQSRIFKKCSKRSRTAAVCRGLLTSWQRAFQDILRLQLTMKNSEPAPGLLEGYYKYI
jgi:hypothetical protein